MTMPWTFIFLTLYSLCDSIAISKGNSIPKQPETLEPININSADVKNIETPLPLTLIIGGPLDFVLLKNTGYSVELIEDDPFTGNILTGGVLGFDKYVYGKTIFYWTNDLNGKVFITVNGKGTPLMICVAYYNVKYKSFDDALHYRDGLAKICNPINVGNIENLLFEKFAYYLTQIEQPNSSVRLPLYFAFLFYASKLPFAKYYAYAGSYTDESSGKTFPCATTIMTPFYPFHFISKEQRTFLKMKGQNGKDLVNNPPRVPRGNRLIEQSTGPLVIIPNFIQVPTKTESS